MLKAEVPRTERRVPLLEGVGELKAQSPLDKQEGGSHYKDLAIQPVEYCLKNNLNYCQSSAIKYVTRAGTKGPAREDVRKAIHFLEIWLEVLEAGGFEPESTVLDPLRAQQNQEVTGRPAPLETDPTGLGASLKAGRVLSDQEVQELKTGDQVITLKKLLISGAESDSFTFVGPNSLCDVWVSKDNVYQTVELRPREGVNWWYYVEELCGNLRWPTEEELANASGE